MPPIIEEGRPWGLIISVALMAYIGYHAKEAQKDPEPYMISAAENVRWFRTTATKSPSGRKILLKVTSTWTGRQLMQLEARYLGLPNSSGAPSSGKKSAPALPVPEPDSPAKKAKGKSSRVARVTYALRALPDGATVEEVGAALGGLELSPQAYTSVLSELRKMRRWRLALALGEWLDSAGDEFMEGRRTQRDASASKTKCESLRGSSVRRPCA